MCPSWGVEMPPVTLGTLKTALTAQGYDLTTRDLNLESYLALENVREFFWNKSNLHYWVNPKLYAQNLFPLLDPLLEEYSSQLAYGPWKLICFTVLSSNVLFINNLVERIKLKNPGKFIAVGGPCLSFAQERVRLRTDIDFFVVGEGEEILPELLDFMEGARQELPEGVYQTRELGKELNFRMCHRLSDFGVPDYSDLDLNQYLLDALPLILTRSCLFKCKFCADHKSMGSFRKLSGQRIFEMFDEFYQRGYRSFWLNDLLINGIMKELVEACLIFEEEGRKMDWIALATPNRQLSTESLEILARNGLRTLNLGVESGSNEVMRMMKKGFNEEQAEEGLRRIVEAGINTQLNIIVGFPGETERHFVETLEFLERNKRWICGFTSVNSCVLLPGSAIANNPAKFGIHWEEGQDMQTEWCVGEENTPKIRLDRLNRVLQWIEANGYGLYSSNQQSMA